MVFLFFSFNTSPLLRSIQKCNPQRQLDMKKLHIIATLLALITILAPCSYAQSSNEVTADRLFKECSKIKDAKHTNISSFMLSMGRMLARGEEKAYLEKIDNMRIVDLSAFSDSDKEICVEKISTTQLADFMPAEEEIKEEQRTSVYVQMKNEYIGKIVIAQLGQREYILMQLNGSLTQQDLEGLAKKHPPVK